jgi:hypothetical protein
VRQLPADRFLRALAFNWASVLTLLPGPAADRLRVLIQRIVAPRATSAAQEAATDEVVDLLMRFLPKGHPLRSDITGGPRTRGARSPEATLEPAAAPSEDPVLAELRALLDVGAAGMVMQEASARLLAAPAVSPAELRDRGVDPDQAHLISLDSPDGPRLPVFQFDAASRPIRVVLDINAVLDADDDPWGAADWWLGRNAWLGRAPAESLGRVPDETLLGMARAVAEGN